METKTRLIGVLGAGQMGAGIAQTAAQSGFQVLLGDQNREAAEKGKSKIDIQLKKLIEKGKISNSDYEKTLTQIQTIGKVEEFSNCDLVVEAVSENEDIKIKLFSQLDLVCKPQAILASNTSSISITKIAAVTKRPEKVVGMHFMNPVPVMKLIEGIRGLQTSDETFKEIQSVSEKMGKTLVESRDFPGFVVNRILMPMINEAIFALYEGIASVQDIDVAMKLGTNQPMGPLALADFIGLDTCEAILNVLYEGLGDPKYRPCPLLKQYVLAGYLGKKAGRGFYTYES